RAWFESGRYWPASALTPRNASGVSPNFLGDLDHKTKLRPLLVLREQVALFGAGKAALWTETELVDIDVFGRGLHPALDLILGFELAGFGRDKTEHDLLALWNKTEWFEAAGSLCVV